MKNRRMLLIPFLLLLSGCSLFSDKRIVVKSKPIDNRNRWKALAPFVKNHFKTDMTVKEIAAELAYAEYLSEESSECLP